MTKVIAVANQKGGVGKTTTTVNLGVGLAQKGNRVLLIDADPQGSLTVCLGHMEPDKLDTTLASIMNKIIQDISLDADEGILHHEEGVDFMPANIDLAGTELTLVATMGRETMLSQYIDVVSANYDYILIDCPPSLGMLTINALKAANSVIIPVLAEILPAKGMTLLIQTISKVRKQLNPDLEIGGILLNLVMAQTNLAKDIAYMLERDFGGKVNIFKSTIPRAVAAAEVPATGKSMFAYDLHSKVTEAYRKLTEEVLKLG